MVVEERRLRECRACKIQTCVRIKATAFLEPELRYFKQLSPLRMLQSEPPMTIKIVMTVRQRSLGALLTDRRSKEP